MCLVDAKILAEQHHNKAEKYLQAFNRRDGEIQEVGRAQAILAKSKQIQLGADRNLLQTMKTTQEAVGRAKVFNDKLQALHMAVGPALHFFQEDDDENRTMAELAERIPDRANAYAKLLAKYGITRALATVQLAILGVELAPLNEF